jgi:hypothetical protein
MPFDKTLRERLAHQVPIRRDEMDARLLATYDLFLKYFRDSIAVPNLSISDAKIGVVLVYTWMQPAQLNPDCWQTFPLAKEVLMREKNGRLNVGDIEALKHFVGGSLIATSKFLHFVNPDRYAMWDTNVARAAYRYSWQQCNRPDRYLQYLDDINELALDDGLRSRVQDAIGSASELRMKEFALFQLGIAESGSKARDPEVDINDLPFAAENFTIDLSVYAENRD